MGKVIAGINSPKSGFCPKKYFELAVWLYANFTSFSFSFFHLAICLCMCILFVHICFSTQLEIRGQHVRIYMRVPGIKLRLSALASVFTHWAISSALHWCLVAGNKTITSFAPASEWAGVSVVNELSLIFRTVNTEFICISLQSSG